MRYYRKIIKIKAEDSPNVRLGLAQQRAGKVPTGEVLVPGVLPWNDYFKRRNTWDLIRQCIGLDAQFYEGAEVLLYPPAWLDRAERLAAGRVARKVRAARGMGIDPAEGGDNTTFAVVDDLGLLDLLSLSTPDTSVIVGQTIALMREWNLDPSQVAFDRGGGGKQIADQLRQAGFNVRTIAFGESVAIEPRWWAADVEEKIDTKEERYAYYNRRAQMYGTLRHRLNPDQPGFAIPARFEELRRQLAPIPLTYDKEGRLKLLPKNKSNKGSKEKTLTELIGCSPDEADALVLAVHAMDYPEEAPLITIM